MRTYSKILFPALTAGLLALAGCDVHVHDHGVHDGYYHDDRPVVVHDHPEVIHEDRPVIVHHDDPSLHVDVHP